MNIDDFLKPKQVRCVIGSSSSLGCLTAGKLYEVIGAAYGRLKIRNDNSGFSWYDMNCFELVIESAENPPQGTKPTPTFEAVEPVLANNSVNIQDIGTNILDTNADIKDTPKFKVGDRVYVGLTGRISKIDSFNSNDERFSYSHNDITTYSKTKDIVKATQENYEMLCKLYPHIKFEQPPKELKGSDLCRAMLEKGWKYVPCYVHDGSDDEAINRKHYVSVKNETPRSGYNFSGTGANDWKYAVPIDPRTGEPLTESVLND